MFPFDRHAIDIRFTDKESICFSDAAFHHLFYSSRTKNGADTFSAPQPYLVQTSANNNTTASQGGGEEGGLKPIKVAQQFKFIPFDQFNSLLNNLDTWIFGADVDMKTSNDDEKWYTSGKPWSEGNSSEPSAISLQHGLLCSASLCQEVLHKLQTMV